MKLNKNEFVTELSNNNEKLNALVFYLRSSKTSNDKILDIPSFEGAEKEYYQKAFVRYDEVYDKLVSVISDIIHSNNNAIRLCNNFFSNAPISNVTYADDSELIDITSKISSIDSSLNSSKVSIFKKISLRSDRKALVNKQSWLSSMQTLDKNCSEYYAGIQDSIDSIINLLSTILPVKNVGELSIEQLYSLGKYLTGDIYDPSTTINVIDVKTGEKKKISLDAYVEGVLLSESFKSYVNEYLDGKINLNQLIQSGCTEAIIARSYGLYQTFGGSKEVESSATKQCFSSAYSNINSINDVNPDANHSDPDSARKLMALRATLARVCTALTANMVLTVVNNKDDSYTVAKGQILDSNGKITMVNNYDYWRNTNPRTDDLVEHPVNARYNTGGLLSNAYSSGPSRNTDSINTKVITEYASQGMTYQEILDKFVVDNSNVNLKYMNYETQKFEDIVPANTDIESLMKKNGIYIYINSGEEASIKTGGKTHQDTFVTVLWSKYDKVDAVNLPNIEKATDSTDAVNINNSSNNGNQNNGLINNLDDSTLSNSTNGSVTNSSNVNNDYSINHTSVSARVDNYNSVLPQNSYSNAIPQLKSGILGPMEISNSEVKYSIFNVSSDSYNDYMNDLTNKGYTQLNNGIWTNGEFNMMVSMNQASNEMSIQLSKISFM